MDKPSPFLFGAQYYRAPTPEPDCWEYDLQRMSEMGFTAMLGPFLSKPEQAAHAVVHVATAPELAGVSGTYFYKTEPKPVIETAFDDELCLKVWGYGERLAGITSLS